MIRSFGNRETEMVFNGKRPKCYPPAILRSAYRKLIALAAANDITDMATPPSNHLKQLQGGMKEWWSIRINIQYRIIFRWRDGEADNVKIIDYH